MNNWDKSIKAITSAVDRTDYLYEVNRQKEMVENYGMPKQTVNTVITELQKKGYIILIPDENDKRSKIIKLTQEGINYANKIVTPLLDCEIRVLKKMGTQRVEMLIDTMNQYADLLETEMKTFYSK